MWDTKYRPVLFSEVLGQQGAVQILKARVHKGTTLDTSYIFSGGSGQGKTTMARILARAALCQNVDKETSEPCNECDQCMAILNGDPSAFEELDAASGGAIETVRSMLSELPFMPPMGAPKRIWLFDEAHRLSLASQDALLKAIEEKKVVGMFCTTEAEKIRGPIRGRCEEYLVRKVMREEVLVRMKYVLDREAVSHEDDGVLIVIDHCGGHIRDILVKLEMISQMGPITVDSVRSYLNLSSVSLYYDVLLSLGDGPRTMQLVEQVCEQVPPEDVSAGLAEAAMNSFRLANKMPADFVYVDRSKAEEVYQKFGNSTLRLAGHFVQGRTASKLGLLCDVLNIVQNNGAVPPSTPPTVILAVAPSVTVTNEGAKSSTPTPSTPVSASVPPMPPPGPPTGATLQKQTSPSLVPGNGKMRTDGVGALGSGDPLALTEEDHKGVPMSFPRRSGTQATVSLSFHGSSEDDQLKPMTPEEWRKEFERTWRMGRS